VPLLLTVKPALICTTLLSGDLNGNRQIDAGETGKSYMAFQRKMLLPAGGTGIVTAISDPSATATVIPLHSSMISSKD